MENVWVEEETHFSWTTKEEITWKAEVQIGNIKMYLRQIGCEDVNFNTLDQDRIQ
jgi:hypothetical protein